MERSSDSDGGDWCSVEIVTAVVVSGGGGESSLVKVSGDYVRLDG